MKLEEGKYYINRIGSIFGPMRKHHNFSSTGWMVAAQKGDLTYFEWFFETETGKRVIEMHDPTSKNHLFQEYREDEVSPEQPSTPIDKVTFAQLQRGVAAIWDSYRI